MARPPKELTPEKSVEDLLGSKIRKLRLAKGWDVTDLATKVFVSTGRISSIETANDPPGRDLTLKLEQVLDAPKGALLELQTLIRAEAFKDYAQRFLRDQALARSIHEFSLGVPGLLQIPGYARALMAVDFTDNPEGLDASVVRRSERQEVFNRESPPWLWVALAEPALHQVHGSPEIMAKQLNHLLEMGERPNIHIQVLPAEQPAVPGSISLLTLQDGARIAYAEGFNTGTYYQEPSDVDRFQRIYDRIQAGALDIDASAQAMRDARRKHQR
ncbi:Scr1 family TA system antitoxin-like transcriptional regulator [Streptomyces sp. NPDC058001]|uniref:helix-turn-helix domain-containing protein n=1 Tax=Streptomyces sp. NPDC058001 TaxID=3346300 RepID=UPI0036EFF552